MGSPAPLLTGFPAPELTGTPEEAEEPVGNPPFIIVLIVFRQDRENDNIARSTVQG